MCPQVIGAVRAVRVIESLKNFETFVRKASIKAGLLNAAWSVRFEIVSDNALTILDGAQELASAVSLKNTL